MRQSELVVFRRRDLLRMLPAGMALASAYGQHCGETPTAGGGAEAPYQFKFFDPDEVQLLRTLTEKIIPADEHSPGAQEARVAEFADLMISSSPEYVKGDWRGGLRQAAEEIQTKGVDAWLDAMAEQEMDPQTVTEVFFRDLKHMTIEGYYTSTVGIHQEMHYQGNTFVAEFKGCDHPEHTS